MLLLNRIFSKTSPLERIMAGTLVFMAFFIFVLGPLLAKNKTLNKEISERNKKFSRYMQLMKREDAIKKEYQKFFFGPDKAAADNSLIYALKALETVASKYAIKVTDVKQNVQAEGGAFTIIELSLEGRKEDYMKFIYDLANGPLLFNIKKCDFKAKENSYLLEAKFFISYIPTR
jgi:hypothetical protein